MLRNSGAGYGLGAKALHWLTVAALVVQFAIGYAIEDFAGLAAWGSDEHGHDPEDDRMVLVHTLVGLVIVLLAVARLLWRRVSPLPPWAPELSARDRVVQHRVEQVLVALLFLVPLSGVALLLLAGEDRDRDEAATGWRYGVVEADLLLGIHVAAHVVLFAALAVHVGLVLVRGTLRRMLW